MGNVAVVADLGSACFAADAEGVVQVVGRSGVFHHITQPVGNGLFHHRRTEGSGVFCDGTHRLNEIRHNRRSAVCDSGADHRHVDRRFQNRILSDARPCKLVFGSVIHLVNTVGGDDAVKGDVVVKAHLFGIGSHFVFSEGNG